MKSGSEKGSEKDDKKILKCDVMSFMNLVQQLKVQTQSKFKYIYW
jgi:hypothetical protein